MPPPMRGIRIAPASVAYWHKTSADGVQGAAHQRLAFRTGASIGWQIRDYPRHVGIASKVPRAAESVPVRGHPPAARRLTGHIRFPLSSSTHQLVHRTPERQIQQQACRTFDGQLQLTQRTLQQTRRVAEAWGRP